MNGSFILVTIGDYTHLVEKEKTNEIILSQLLKQKFYWQTVLFLLHSYDETVNGYDYYELIKVTLIVNVNHIFHSLKFYLFISALVFIIHFVYSDHILFKVFIKSDLEVFI